MTAPEFLGHFFKKNFSPFSSSASVRFIQFFEWYLMKNIFLLFFLLASTAYADPQSTVESHKVIIVGAGFAGLEAANYLQSHGIDDFIILEASDHLGGRAYTIPWNNVDLSLGASWIHGVGPKNPLTKLVDKWHLAVTNVDDDSGILYYANGKELSDEENHSIEHTYHQFVDVMKAKRNEPDSAKKYENASVSDLAVDFIQSQNLDNKAEAGLVFNLVDNVEENYAADITQLSALWYDSDVSLSDVDQMLVHGYKELIEGISECFQDKIALNQVVKEINYKAKDQITVTTAEGKKFAAKYVVCTVPIGVLKHGTIKFDPELPEDKLEALEHINMGTMNKIVMRFPVVFWDEEQYINYIAPAYWSGQRWVNKGVWSLFYNLHTFIGKPMLMALVAGDFAIHLEKQSDQQIIDSAMTALRVIYGSDIPNPTSYIVTRWGQNPFTRGSFSSLGPGALEDGDDYWNLAQTIEKRLLFAGEGTSDYYPATVYGAYLTGDRAAMEILEFEKQP
jgi:monoamine oxidase